MEIDMKNISGNAEVSGDAKVSGNAKVYGNAEVYGTALVSGTAEVSGNAWVYGDAWVYGNAEVYGNAKVYGTAWVSGDAEVYGDADIQSNDDWFSFIYNSKTLTGYRSRNESGYELNVDGKDIAIEDLKDGFDIVVRNLIKKFTPFENKEKDDLKSVISDLEKQLEEAKNRLKEI